MLVSVDWGGSVLDGIGVLRKDDAEPDSSPLSPNFAAALMARPLRLDGSSTGGGGGALRARLLGATVGAALRFGACLDGRAGLAGGVAFGLAAAGLFADFLAGLSAGLGAWTATATTAGRAAGRCTAAAAAATAVACAMTDWTATCIGTAATTGMVPAGDVSDRGGTTAG